MFDIPNKSKRQVGLSSAERLNKYRVMNDECWETSLDLGHKYPQIKIDGRKIMVHRLAYETYLEPIPAGLNVLHKCDNPRCHRPSHLFLGTTQDNMRDMVAKGRHRSGPKLDVDERAIVRLGSALTQVEVAECMGVSQTVVSKVLRKHNASRGKQTSFGKNHGRGGRSKK